MHKSSGGFSGRGFKFDETEAQLAAERKKLQRKALGLQDSDDEDLGLDVSAVQGVLVASCQIIPSLHSKLRFHYSPNYASLFAKICQPY